MGDSDKRYVARLCLIAHALTDLALAIDYIRACQMQERQLHNDVQRLQRESDVAREAHRENDMLKTEIQVMHQHLRRLDPAAPHVYGHFTQQLSQQAGQTQPPQPQPQQNGTSAGISLPPLGAGPPNGASAPQPASYGGVPPPAAMQGVEYGYGR